MGIITTNEVFDKLSHLILQGESFSMKLPSLQVPQSWLSMQTKFICWMGNLRKGNQLSPDCHENGRFHVSYIGMTSQNG